jgi:hypothetical protein
VFFRSRRFLIPLGTALLLVAGLAIFSRTGSRPAPDSFVETRGSTARLVVLVIFDQLRGDYLTRWDKLFTEDGFRRLQREGAWFSSCHFPYAYTATAPGHASLITGCSPRTHGIIANGWYDRASREVITAVRVPRYRLVPSRSDADRGLGASPERRLAPSVGELLHDFSGKSKVISLSLKDRAAVLLSGPPSSLCYWLNSGTGEFVTSTYYESPPRPWVTEFNAGKTIDRWFDTPWTYLRPEIDYAAHSGPDDVTEEGTGVKQGRTFPHPMNAGLSQPGPAYYDALANSPYGNDLLLELARKAIDEEKLGQGGPADLLCLSFSSNDVVGHCWGPDSQEVLDTTLRSDLIVKQLLEHLDARVGKGRYMVVLTGDHGICPLPAVARRQGKDAARVNPDNLLKGAQQFLKDAFPVPETGPAWIVAGEDGYYYLNRELAREQRQSIGELEKALAGWLVRQEGIQAAYTRSQLLLGLPPGDALGEKVRRNFHPERSGDVVAILKPYHLFFPALSTGTDHGSPHDYDSHVPLLICGPNIRPGVRNEPVSPLVVAPILAWGLGVPRPDAAEADIPDRLLK